MGVLRGAIFVLGLGAIALKAVPANPATPPAVFQGSDGNVYVHSGVTSDTFNPPTSTPFKTKAGRVVLPGYTVGVSYDVRFNNLPASADVTVNACNFANIRNTIKRPLPASIKINGKSYTLASLTMADPPSCRRNFTTGVPTKYIPATW